MRTFVAVDLNSEVKARLSDLITLLKRSQPKIKWVNTQGMHITLKFLGEIPESRVPEIRESIHNACEGHTSFTLSFKGTGTFPPGSLYPRVIWVGIEESKPLSALQRDIENALEKVHFPKEKRDFNPHLTLGRVKASGALSALLSELKNLSDADFGRLCVQNVLFIQSILRPKGAEYKPLSEFLLK